MGQTEAINLPLLLVAGVIGMLLLAIAVILFFLVYQKRLLAQQSKLLRLESDHQKGLLISSIQTQEEERKRIASDLHDSVGSLLSATKLYLRQLNPEGEDVAYIKKESLHLINETILNIRNITHNLLPLSLQQFGLIAAVEDLVDRMNKLNKVIIEFKCEEDLRFASEKEIAIYRIIQELLNNTFKHAEATHVQINVEFKEGKLYALYIDNGKGFDWADHQQKNHTLTGLGLKSIESRINFLNGTIKIKSDIGQGIHVAIVANI